jgi:protein phosphatase 1 regulatory subunit 7
MQGIEKFNEVLTINLSDNIIWTLETLPQSWKVVRLYVSENRIFSLKGIERLQKLLELDIKKNRIARIEYLDKLPHLSDLDLGHNPIKKIENLEGCIALTRLSLNDTHIAKIEGLDTLVNLNMLDLSGCKITKVENLGALKKLRLLYLGRNPLTDLEGLKEVPWVVELSLQESGLTGIVGLEKSDGLGYLDLTGNKIGEIDISSLKSLYILRLDKNPVKKLAGLAGSTVGELYLGECSLDTLDGIHELRESKVKFLALQDNALTDMAALPLPVTLIGLKLGGNHFMRIAGLSRLKDLSLGELDLKKNPIEEITRADLVFLRGKGLQKSSWLEADIASGKIRVVDR